jgi:hypothetical protein
LNKDLGMNNPKPEFKRLVEAKIRQFYVKRDISNENVGHLLFCGNLSTRNEPYFFGFKNKIDLKNLVNFCFN